MLTIEYSNSMLANVLQYSVNSATILHVTSTPHPRDDHVAGDTAETAGGQDATPGVTPGETPGGPGNQRDDWSESSDDNDTTITKGPHDNSLR